MWRRTLEEKQERPSVGNDSNENGPQLDFETWFFSGALNRGNDLVLHGTIFPPLFNDEKSGTSVL